MTYTGGGGNDTLDLDGTTLQNTFVYNGGNGDDALELGGAALKNTFSYNGGSGADSLNLNGAALSGALTFDGGISIAFAPDSSGANGELYIDGVTGYDSDAGTFDSLVLEILAETDLPASSGDLG